MKKIAKTTTHESFTKEPVNKIGYTGWGNSSGTVKYLEKYTVNCENNKDVFITFKKPNSMTPNVIPQPHPIWVERRATLNS